MVGGPGLPSDTSRSLRLQSAVLTAPYRGELCIAASSSCGSMPPCRRLNRQRFVQANRVLELQPRLNRTISSTLAQASSFLVVRAGQRSTSRIAYIG